MRVAHFANGLFLWMLTFNVMQMPLISADTPSVGEECSQKALRSYFPEKFVRETLKKFHVPEDKWTTITQGLTGKEQDFEKNVEAKAEKMPSNPLRDPNQRQAAVKIFKESLYEVASQVFKANGISDDRQIQDMVDDIQHQKARQFAQCIEKHKLPPMPMPNGSNSPSTHDSNAGYTPGVSTNTTKSNGPNSGNIPSNAPSYTPGNMNR